jgi:tRNA G18 (ribose-2'-O)-methylase SpoU
MDRKLRTHEMGRLSLDEFKEKNKNPIQILLDNVRSAHNVGSIFRTADAFRCESLQLCGITPKPPHPDLEKTALGATQSMNWNYFSEITEALLINQDRFLVGVEITKNAISLEEFVWPDKEITIALGHEVYGLSDECINKCDAIVSIPQFGTKHSLNVAVSNAIVIWDYYTKKKAG